MGSIVIKMQVYVSIKPMFWNSRITGVFAPAPFSFGKLDISLREFFWWECCDVVTAEDCSLPAVYVAWPPVAGLP